MCVSEMKCRVNILAKFLKNVHADGIGRNVK
jgi:hypothetical protein